LYIAAYRKKISLLVTETCANGPPVAVPSIDSAIIAAVVGSDFCNGTLKLEAPDFEEVRETCCTCVKEKVQLIWIIYMFDQENMEELSPLVKGGDIIEKSPPRRALITGLLVASSFLVALFNFGFHQNSFETTSLYVSVMI
jgi:hypothetical protein